MAIERLLITSSSPHDHSGRSIRRIMWTVVVVLLPAAVFAVFSFGLPALVALLLTIGAAVGSEAAWQAAARRPQTVADGSSALTGLLLALNLPPSAPWWVCLAGGLVAAVLGKAVFGGLGQNPFNPALTARVFLLIAFPVPMTQWLLPEVLEPARPESGQAADLPRTVPSLANTAIVYPDRQGRAIPDLGTVGAFDDVDVDGVTAASPLGLVAEAEHPGQTAGRLDLLSLFYGGGEPGSLGEVSALILLLGGIALLLMRIITWHVPVAFLATMAAIAAATRAIDPAAFAGPLFHLFAGGAMIGAWFMATDYVTSPMYPRGKLLFGAGCGALTMIIRLWGGYPEGVSFAILLMNAVVPLIDRATGPRIFGVAARFAGGAPRGASKKPGGGAAP